MSEFNKISWSPRVPRQKIRLLYEKDAQGIVDENLINDVGFSFYTRCSDIITITEASKGRMKCLKCEHIIPHQWNNDEILICEKCSWETTWGEYHRSYKGKHFHPGLVEEVIRNYVDRFPKARTPQKKMVLIDTIIHECHKWLNKETNEFISHRPLAVNLIQGNETKIIELLTSLADGEGNTMGVKERRVVWKNKIDKYTDKKFGKIF